MIGQFQELLEALSKVFNLALHVDRSNACCIQIHEGLSIQLQLDVSQENLWIFSKIVEIPPGKFRENIFKETLKENGLADPRIAVFGYLADTNHLALFQKYPLHVLNGERLSGFLGAFLMMAENWRNAIESGLPAPQKEKQTNQNPFGLK
ncbi:MAG: hypothetical protein COT85_07155 [Chlamydiae bacterium CG10_big_fil_rev_8_21_14_0_10_42_34]|nr:MAG: hypothetical protein COT85_07155 [Chlamydiae bacterium CG10_big_fil_rev_8_21_14_0_10_42_34]